MSRPEIWTPRTLTMGNVNGQPAIILRQDERFLTACPVISIDYHDLTNPPRSIPIPPEGTVLECEYCADDEFEGVRVHGWAHTSLSVLHPELYVTHTPGNLIDQDLEDAGLDPDINLGRMPS